MSIPIRGGAYPATSPNGGGNTPQQVVIDTADTNYPYTSLSGNSVVVRGAGSISISAKITMGSGFNVTAQLRINGTTVATGNTATVSTITYVYNAAHSGDLLALWETDNGGGGFAITGGAANTFLHYDVPAKLAPAGIVISTRAASI